MKATPQQQEQELQKLAFFMDLQQEKLKSILKNLKPSEETENTLLIKKMDFKDEYIFLLETEIKQMSTLIPGYRSPEKHMQIADSIRKGIAYFDSLIAIYKNNSL